MKLSRFYFRGFVYLILEDLVSNVIIELAENNINRAVSYPVILEYGNAVIKELEKRNIEAILLIYRDKTLQFEDDYKEIFNFLKQIILAMLN